MPRISDQIKDLIVKKMKAGYKQIEVAEDLMLGQSTVHYIWKKYLKFGSTTDGKRTGRPIKATLRERRNLCRTSKRNPFLSAAEVYRLTNGPTELSKATVKRYLNRGGLCGRIAAKKTIY